MNMKIPARISALLTAIVALFCYYLAYRGRVDLAGITDPAALRDARGFLGFILFLGTVFLAIRLQLSNDVLPALGGSKHASTSSSSSHGLCAVHGMTSFQKMSVDFAIPPVLGMLMLLSFLVLHVSHCADHCEWQMLTLETLATAV